MTEEQRNKIIRLHNSGWSQRRISRLLGVSRGSVVRVLAAVAEQRREGAHHPELPRPKKSRPSLLDPFDDFIAALLETYPDLTAVRLLEELRDKGFTGGYSIVKDHLQRRRPRPDRPLVMRFETGPGVQAQMDYSTYTVAFRSGTRRVHAFSYILSWSRRQYVHFVERQDFATTVREHVNAFDYFGGLARTCLYDNMRVVVDRWEDGVPVYNRRFLAFATHYGYRPWACKPYRSQTKGKVERPFRYIEKNLLNGRTFTDLEHLNSITAKWLDEVADQRVHRETKQRPRERFEEERAQLLALPGKPYDTAEVRYRVVDAEGLIAHQTNRYSVPWQRLGQTLAVRVTESEVIVYAPDLSELARHERRPDGARERVTIKTHRPDDSRQREAQLRERFAELGATGERFLDELVANHRYGRDQATRILSLLGLYRSSDLVRALERALRYRALSCDAVERILAAQAEPRPITELDAEGRRRLDELGGPAVPPRSGEDYDALLAGDAEDEPSATENRTDAPQDQDVDDGQANDKDEEE